MIIDIIFWNCFFKNNFSETCTEPSQTSKMELFKKIFNGSQTIFAKKKTVLDV